MSSDEPTSPGSGSPASEPNHGRRIAVIWFVLAAVATPIVVLVWGPHLPPGDATVQAQHQQEINTILAGIVTPVVLAIIVYALYTLIVFRDRGEVGSDGPPIRGDRRIATAWIAFTAAVVVFVVSYGTYDLARSRGRVRFRARPGSDRPPGRQAARGPGHRPTVAVHVPLPVVRGSRDAGSRDPRRPLHRVPRDVP